MPIRKEDISIDEILKAAAPTTLQKTPELLPGDDMSSKRNFYDTITANVSHLNKKESRKFKEMEFSGVVLRARLLEDKADLVRRTSEVFANHVFSSTKNVKSKIWELFVHITEISGILPQPTYGEISNYKNSLLEGFQKKVYERKTDRFPKFYCSQDTPPEILDIWKVRFPDENFFYYGRAVSQVLSGAEIVKIEQADIENTDSDSNKRNIGK
jgi:hypothetical protein